MPARSVYLTGLESGGGKSAIALGLAELLSRRVERLGVFRPLHREAKDPIVELVRERYQLPEAAAGVGHTYRDAAAMVGAGRQDELFADLIDRYHAVASISDAVIVVGTDYGWDAGQPVNEPGLPDELGINLRLATEMRAALLGVVHGEGRTAEEVTAAIRTAYFTLSGRAGGGADRKDLVAVIANRVPPEHREAVLNSVAGLDVPVYVVPDVPVVRAPTMGEVVAMLGATPVLGGGEVAMNRLVLKTLIGGATVPTFLDYVTDGALVVTPGDRADLVVACAAAHSTGLATVAGMVLTLGIQLDARVASLLGRFDNPPTLISVAQGSSATVAAVRALEGRLTASNPSKIEAALGTFESNVDVAELSRRLDVVRSDRVTPMMFEYELIERARTDRRHVVLPEGTEERILRATEILLRRDVAELTLLGSADEIARKSRELGLDLSGVHVVDPATSPWREQFAAEYTKLRAHRGVTLDQAQELMYNVNYFGTMMVHSGRADAMVSGAIHPTSDTIRPAFEIIRTLPDVSIASSVFFMCLPEEVLVYGDCAVNPDPNAAQLADIAISSADTAAKFGLEPRVAMLSYSTGMSGAGADVDKVAEATKLVRERRPDLLVDGPLQYDAAVDPTVAETKAPGSPVAGRATVLIFPDLNTGNNTYKAVQRSAGAVAVGPVLQGLRKPVNDLSRGATVKDIVSTVAITAIQAHR